ncbi:MAG TPA: hypothetical protein VN903_14320 [Polyangia bacterium]|nr:hypothetical protein [Polyangia bacterium]
MRRRLLDEAEAWREIARRIESRGLKSSGLCAEVIDAIWASYGGPRFVTRSVGDAMLARIEAKRIELGLGVLGHFYRPFDPAPRNTLARTFAVLAEQEAAVVPTTRWQRFTAFFRRPAEGGAR